MTSPFKDKADQLFHLFGRVWKKEVAIIQASKKLAKIFKVKHGLMCQFRIARSPNIRKESSHSLFKLFPLSLYYILTKKNGDGKGKQRESPL